MAGRCGAVYKRERDTDDQNKRDVGIEPDGCGQVEKLRQWPKEEHGEGDQAGENYEDVRIGKDADDAADLAIGNLVESTGFGERVTEAFEFR